MGHEAERDVDVPVTVVIAAYNQRWCLENTVASVIYDQGPVRCIIVVDACPFATGDLAREIAAANPACVEAIELEKNIGQAGARDVGLRRVRTPWVLFLDGDDLLEPGAIPALLKEAEADPQADALLARFVRTDDSGDVIKTDRRLATVGHHVVLRHQQFEPAPLTVESFLTDFRIGPPGTWLVRADAIRAAGGFDPVMRSNEDLECMARLIVTARVHESHQMVLSKRMHPKQQSHDTLLQRWTHLRACWRVLRRATPETRPGVVRGLYGCFVLRARTTVEYGSFIEQWPKAATWRTIAVLVGPAARFEQILRRLRGPLGPPIWPDERDVVLSDSVRSHAG